MSTQFLARWLGLWLIAISVGMLINRDFTIGAVNMLFANVAIAWVAGVFTLLLGLAIVLVHNHWSGGALCVVVTIYGWAALIKGLLLVWLPLAMQNGFYQAMHFPQLWVWYAVVAFLVGAYLAYGGFKPDAATQP